MTINIPKTLEIYTPVIAWIYCLFEKHEDLDTEKEVHSKINFLLKLYSEGENICKLAYDLADAEFWQRRTIAFSRLGEFEEVPQYWNPLYEPFSDFLQRELHQKNKVLKTLIKMGSYPPKDILLVHINTILKNGTHPLLENKQYQDDCPIKIID